ncbi:hypothetical protein SEPL_436 [Salmonella phage SE_PL]|uniref:hypothetical protein n=1 Tax=Salmonella enterica TaxID=28901 RepID=UPI000FDF788F|nr:hypothetical protein CPT_Munch_533 [Salmonella phage Munch]EAZ2022793.1 hypothetical protein [Salmonella enterica]ECV9083928.1 hypothetical protein [Salmonella enterica subsp. enterica serovar Infantis]MCP0435471.1 hypothetical protein [Salmonella enterica subsp. enterica serovar Mbandaka]QCW18640.1 hypothetical protein 7t3_0119 [Salmonella phage 7t3]QIG63049.1 hypothetical protein SEPL_436 [Salmonella phage SE_PL]
MFGTTSDFIVIISLTLMVMLFLDYVFGADKLEFARTFLVKNQEWIFALGWIGVGTIFKCIGIFTDSETLYGLGTFYVWIIIGAFGIYYGSLYVVKFILNLRSANIAKRKKPR